LLIQLKTVELADLEAIQPGLSGALINLSIRNPATNSGVYGDEIRTWWNWNVYPMVQGGQMRVSAS